MGREARLRAAVATPREKVFVGVLSLDGRVEVEIAAFMARTLGRGYPVECSWEFQCCSRPIPWARNQVVGKFLASGASRLLFLDDDVIPTEALDGLFVINGDIVAAAVPIPYPQEHGRCGWDAYRVVDGKGQRVVVNEDVIQVDMVGAGATIIRRAVLEDPRMRFPSRPVTLPFGRGTVGEAAPAVFQDQATADGRGAFAEDLNFSWRASRLGYRVLYAAGIQLGHRKRIDLRILAGVR